MAKVITNDIKAHMMSKIREKVRAAYFEREVGEELHEAEAAIKAVVTEEINALFPPGRHRGSGKAQLRRFHRVHRREHEERRNRLR